MAAAWAQLHPSPTDSNGGTGREAGDPAFWKAYNESPFMAYDNPLAIALEIASPEEVMNVLQKPDFVVLDVRSTEEILRDGLVNLEGISKANGKWLYMPCCLPEECQLFEKAVGNLIPNRRTPIVVHCTSGVSAAEAKIILKSQGYIDVVNAGRFRDIQTIVAQRAP